MLGLLKLPNFYAVAALVALGGMIVSGIYVKGARDAQRKWALEMAERNKPILVQRGQDEAEVPANDQAGKATADAVAGAVSQTCPLTPESARLLASVK